MPVWTVTHKTHTSQGLKSEESRKEAKKKKNKAIMGDRKVTGMSMRKQNYWEKPEKRKENM